MVEWDLHMFCKLPLILFFPSPRMGILNFSNVSPREMSMNTWKQQEWTILQSIYGRYLKSCHFENFQVADSTPNPHERLSGGLATRGSFVLGQMILVAKVKGAQYER